MNKFMRLLVFFDLPVVKDRDKKVAAKFRRFLVKEYQVNNSHLEQPPQS